MKMKKLFTKKLGCGDYCQKKGKIIAKENVSRQMELSVQKWSGTEHRCVKSKTYADDTDNGK